MLVDMLSIPLAIAYSLIGLAGVIVAVVGVLLPRSERLTALLALVAGAGVGIIGLAIGSATIDASADLSEDVSETVFLVASILGFIATVATVLLLRSATRRAAGDTAASAISDPSAS